MDVADDEGWLPDRIHYPSSEDAISKFQIRGVPKAWYEVEDDEDSSLLNAIGNRSNAESPNSAKEDECGDWEPPKPHQCDHTNCSQFKCPDYV